MAPGFLENLWASDLILVLAKSYRYDSQLLSCRPVIVSCVLCFYDNWELYSDIHENNSGWFVIPK